MGAEGGDAPATVCAAMVTTHAVVVAHRRGGLGGGGGGEAGAPGIPIQGADGHVTSGVTHDECACIDAQTKHTCVDNTHVNTCGHDTC